MGAIRRSSKLITIAFVTLGLAAVGTPIVAAEDTKSLEDKLEQLEAQVESLREQVQVARKEIRNATEVVAVSSEWRDATSAFHIAGYASAGYSDKENGTGAFSSANFNPIFHFQYKDLVLWEAELEFEVEEEGGTEINLEYSTIDFFLNDYLVLVGGKFLSPLGQFRQNLHPHWINKLPSAPPGFGHDGAAPIADVGFQLRGGAPFGAGRVNYAFYVGNGPELEGEGGEVHAILTDGFTRDADGDKVLGGRIGFLPVSNLEIGLSAAIGDATVTEDDGIEVVGDPSRDYDVFGVDFVYHWRELELRGEYIKQKIDNAVASIAPEGGDWEALYVQGAYKFGHNSWEGVLRYTDFNSPHASQQQEQWAIGLNYLVAPNAIVKFGYEINDNEAGGATDEDRWLIQLAYGY